MPELLRARGATPAVTLDVLALELRAGGTRAPSPSPSARDVHLRWQTDITVAREAAALGVEAFGGSMPPDDRLAEYAERDRAAVPAGEGGLLVAYAGGVAVGVGGVIMADGVARRGRGVYRAVLAARLTYGAAHGATMALVKGKIETSGPILRRPGSPRTGRRRSTGYRWRYSRAISLRANTA